MRYSGRLFQTAETEQLKAQAQQVDSFDCWLMEAGRGISEQYNIIRLHRAFKNIFD